MGVNKKAISAIHVRKPSLTTRKKYGGLVKDFLEREHNSIIQPEKWNKICRKRSKTEMCTLRLHALYVGKVDIGELYSKIIQKPVV